MFRDLSRLRARKMEETRVIEFSAVTHLGFRVAKHNLEIGCKDER